MPLKKDTFEECNIYVPNKFKFCLFQEYGSKVVLPKYKKWIFNGKKWVINNKN
jgi:hypothetical protein